MNENKDKQNYYNSLSGAQKSVPIILAAVAAFVAVCLFSNSGFLGNGIGAVLKGLFSFGAYAIPVTLAIHALCFAVDIAEKRLNMRIAFSVITILAVSAIEYAICNWGGGAVFTPGAFFAAQTSGGFIGSIIGFVLMFALGHIGVIVVALAVLAIFATFFYADRGGFFGSTAKSVSGGITGVIDKVKTKINDKAEKDRQQKEEQAQLELEANSQELIDDDFFKARGNASDVKVAKLGIKETSDTQGTTPLVDPTLRPVYEEPAPIVVEERKRKRSADKPLDLSYGMEESELNASTDVEEESAEKISESTPENTVNNRYGTDFYGLDDSADNVFTKTFDPFDFATNEKRAAKPSSKATPIEEELDEMTLYEMKANHVPTEREKRMMELERRKQEWMKSRGMSAPSPKTEPASKTAPAPEVQQTVTEPAPQPSPAYSPAPSYTPAPNYNSAPSYSAPTYTPASVAESASEDEDIVSSTVTVETMEAIKERIEANRASSQMGVVPEKVDAYTSYSTTQTTYTYAQEENESVAESSAVAHTASAQPLEEATEDLAILIGERIAKNNPAYMRSANEMKTYTRVVASSDEDNIFAPAAHTEINEAKQDSLDVEDSAPAIQDVSPAEEVASGAPASATETEFTFGEPAPQATEEEIKFEKQPEESTAAEATEAAGEEVIAEEAEDTVEEVKNKNNPYQRAAIFAAEMIGAVKTAQEPVIQIYEAPEIPEATEEIKEEATLKVEREMIAPSPDTISFEPVAASTEEVIDDDVFTVVDDDASEDSAESDVNEDAISWTGDEESEENQAEDLEEESDKLLDFENEDDEEDSDNTDVADAESENIVDEKIFEEAADDEADIEEIPPEQQNPEVIKMREMFPFLAPLDEQKTAQSGATAEEDTAAEPEAVVEDTVEENEEDDVPFDEPIKVKEDVKIPPEMTGLVALDQIKEEPKKSKPDYSNYEFPPIDLLAKEESLYDENIQAEIQENADKLIETLASFGVTASIKGVDRGPRITRYEVVPAKGVKVSSILNLQDDIALSLAAGSIRMEAPIPGKSAVGIEIPNKKSATVRLRNLLETEDFKSSKSKTFVCIGRDVAGQPVFGDISKMPHLLIAGATGMGKSVSINSLLISILYKARPDEVKFIMIDPKQVEFTMYNGIPHLLVPVVSDPKQAAGSLMWAVEEMERRFERLKPLCVRNIDAYNEKVTEDPSLGEPMSKIIIVIDEFADLMLQVKDPVEALVMRIAQKARAAGIHLVIGTQRPSVNVITGVIKANVPSRISCKVMSNVDSKTVLDSAGAEKLLDRGDMLYAPTGSPKPHRVQGAFVADGEVESIMAYLQKYSDGSNYDSTVMEEIERAAQKCSKKGGSADRDDDDDESSGEGYLNDRQFLDAVEIAVNTRKISTSLIQRKLSVGYGKAAKFIDIMEDMGIVGESNGQRPREVLLTPDEWREKLARASLE